MIIYSSCLNYTYSINNCVCVKSQSWSLSSPVIEGNENGEPVIAERQIRIMDKPLGQRDFDDGML